MIPGSIMVDAIWPKEVRGYQGRRLWTSVSWQFKSAPDKQASTTAFPRSAAKMHTVLHGYFLYWQTAQGFFKSDRNVGRLSVLKVIRILGHCTWAAPNNSLPKPALCGWQR